MHLMPSLFFQTSILFLAIWHFFLLFFFDFQMFFFIDEILFNSLFALTFSFEFISTPSKIVNKHNFIHTIFFFVYDKRLSINKQQSENIVHTDTHQYEPKLNQRMYSSETSKQRARNILIYYSCSLTAPNTWHDHAILNVVSLWNSVNTARHCHNLKCAFSYYLHIIWILSFWNFQFQSLFVRRFDYSERS